jgi:hypothetical protein
MIYGLRGPLPSGGESLGHIGEATGFESRRIEGERISGIMRAIAIEEEACAA